MQEKTRQKLLGIGVLIVAAVFITSYAAFGNNGGSNTTTSTTTIKPATTYYVSGNAIATVGGYGSQLYLTLTGTNSSVNSTVTSLLNRLESNNSVSTYINNPNGYYVSLGNATAYSFYRLIAAKVNASQFVVNSTAVISLPKVVKLYYRGVGLNVTMPKSNYTVQFLNPVPIGSALNVTVAALATANGTIFNNQIRITFQGH
ncbi:MAG: hypothetical protein KGH60_02030 [Candidatus Micrarchaeota archaeon]|nr:hypothetical protein [Candidatus Micrarchaeota archaeon]